MAVHTEGVLRSLCDCRFPGCDRHIRQMHHIVHWTGENGPTNADNLIGLCWDHHHLVHEGNWTIKGNPNHTVWFQSPKGREISSRPQPISADVRHLLDRSLSHLGPP